MVTFTDSPRWATLHEEVVKAWDIIKWNAANHNKQLGAMRELVDVDHSKVSPPSPDDSLDDGLSPDSDTDHEFCFLPSQIFYLWKIFLNRVHPVTKILHAPSTQLHVVDAACTSGSGLSDPIQALLFSIYNAALFTLSNDECLESLGRHKRHVSQSCAKALRIRLRKANFLRSASLTTLQALVLYLVSVQKIFLNICPLLIRLLAVFHSKSS